MERCVREVARSLAGRYEVSFIGDEFDADGMDGVRFLALNGRRLRSFLAPLSFRYRVARRLRTGRPDVVISWGAECPPGDLQAVASVHRAWLRHGRPIPTRVGTMPSRARYLMPQHLIRLLLERGYFRTRADSVVSVLSDQNADEVTGLYHVDRSRLVIIPNGYSAAEFSVDLTVRMRPAKRAELGLADEDVLVLLVANELHRKGFATLLEAVAILSETNVRVAVVGKKPIDSYLPQIARLGLTDRVQWYGPSDDVAQWYAAADLFVMPSQYEAYPLVVIEALASGLPVITTALAGSLDAVRPGVNGLLLSDPQDPEELAGLLRRGLDPATRGAWRTAAPGSVARLEWRILSNRYAELIDHIAAQHSGSPQASVRS